MTPLASIVGAALIHLVWQGTIVGAVLALALLALRNASPRARYALSCTALVIIGIAPLATIIGLSSLHPVHPLAEGPLAGISPRTLVGIPETMLPIWIEPAAPHLLWLAAVQAWAVPIWSVGVLLLSIRLALGGFHVFSVGRGGAAAAPHLVAATAACAKRLGVSRPVRIVTSEASDVPAVVGWWRPVILLPPAACLGLAPAQLEGIVAHELAHVARNDYAVNIAQTIIETIFFYHPVVWWISGQIRTERELCCDDLAITVSGDSLGYARALTTLEKVRGRTARLALGSTGGPLLYRIERLIGGPSREHTPSPLPSVLVLCLGLACIALNFDRVAAQSAPASLRFEVASVKPSALDPGHVSINRRGSQYTASGLTLKRLVAVAYQLQDDQIFGGPKWFDESHYDIVAKFPAEDAASLSALPAGVTREQLMLRLLLADRFGLAVHTEVRQLPVYALVPARKDGALGPGLTRVEPCIGGRPAANSAAPPTFSGLNPPTCGTSAAPGHILGGAITMPILAASLSRLTNTGMFLNRPVVDQTGLTGSFNVALQFLPDTLPDFGPDGPPPGLIDPAGPSLFSAIQAQHGLKLEATKGPVDVLVVDRAETPTPD